MDTAAKLFEEVPIDTADEFLEALRPSNPHWVINKRWSTNWVFRGQSDANWLLLPSAWRRAQPGQEKSEAEKLIDAAKAILRPNLIPEIERLIRGRWAMIGRVQNDSTALDEQRVVEVLLQAYVEFSIVDQFTEFSDSLGYQIRFSPYFNEKSSAFLSRYIHGLFPSNTNQHDNYNIWAHSAFAIAQHHGIPTRLLDWTRNPLVAAYFAAEGVRRDLDDGKRIAVYAMPMFLLQKDRSMTLDIPRSENIYLRSQDGTFSLDKLGDEYFRDTGKWLDLETSFSLRNTITLTSNKLTPLKLTLSVAEVAELMRLLWLEKITRAHLMPTIDSITMALKAKWQWSLMPETHDDD